MTEAAHARNRDDDRPRGACVRRARAAALTWSATSTASAEPSTSGSSTAVSRTRPFCSPPAAAIRAAQEAAGQAPCLGAPGRPRVPGHAARSPRRTCRCRACTRSARTTRHRQRLLRHGVRRGPHLSRPAAAGVAPAERAAIYDDMNDVLARLHRVDYARRRTRRLRQARQLLRASDRALDKQYEAAKTDDVEAMDNLIAWLPAHIPPERRDLHRARRLPSRELDLPPDRAAHDRGARLGALDARPPARRPRLQLHAVPREQPDPGPLRRASTSPRPGSRASATTSPRTAGAPAARRSSTGSSTSRSRSSAWRRSRRASTSAASTATPARTRRGRMARSARSSR